MENQLTELFKKYPHLKKQKDAGVVFEVLIEMEINGGQSAFKLFENYIKCKRLF